MVKIKSHLDAQPFFIEYLYKDNSEIAEVKPCCEDEGSLFYYDIYMRNQYQFTVTPFADDGKEMAWKISLKNSDKNIEKEVIDIIGQEIEKHLL